MKLKDAAITKEKIKQLNEILEYFDEVVLCVPDGLYLYQAMGPARGDDRLYIHGVKVVNK